MATANPYLAMVQKVQEEEEKRLLAEDERNYWAGLGAPGTETDHVQQ